MLVETSNSCTFNTSLYVTLDHALFLVDNLLANERHMRMDFFFVSGEIGPAIGVDITISRNKSLLSPFPL